ncbi:hypothetical protein DIURU_005561 [Diutina rugosa]|uniref:PRELI/MSF1 domain-containing protein n=1 Tax=Diutina rugosa TaxID=5481 RepID=A0A642UCU6_DIURU|nr:uncharacterized protein DIURU_005561 [Diutina rugosa]KAA8896821.1 hypothetical protein DIURU_005561 [Diutina rugosa]
MKFFESQHHFDYPWNQVTAANWRKYPNEMAPHVVSVDVLSRSVDPKSKVLRTERLIGCKQGVPRWLSIIVGGQEMSYVREVSEVDLTNQTLVMKSSNMTMNHLLLVNETVIYRPDPDFPEGRTLFQQHAEITAYASISRLCDKIEKWAVERFGQNAATGKLAFEGVCDKLCQKWNESEKLVTEVADDVSNVAGGIVNQVRQLGWINNH